MDVKQLHYNDAERNRPQPTLQRRVMYRNCLNKRPSYISYTLETGEIRSQMSSFRLPLVKVHPLQSRWGQFRKLLKLELAKLTSFPKWTRTKALQVDVIFQMKKTWSLSIWRHFWDKKNLKQIQLSSFPKWTKTKAGQFDVVSKQN